MTAWRRLAFVVEEQRLRRRGHSLTPLVASSALYGSRESPVRSWARRVMPTPGSRCRPRNRLRAVRTVSAVSLERGRATVGLAVVRTGWSRLLSLALSAYLREPAGRMARMCGTSQQGAVGRDVTSAIFD